MGRLGDADDWVCLAKLLEPTEPQLLPMLFVLANPASEVSCPPTAAAAYNGSEDFARW